MTISYVFDTYARTAEGRKMHFNIVLDEQDQQKAIACAQHWLNSINLSDAVVIPENCFFYHSLEVQADMRTEIDKNGYAIYKMEGCPR